MKSAVLTILSAGTIFSLCCAFHLVSIKSKSGSLSKSQVTFYKAPLVCSAAPEIGCGSKAKPVLKRLEENSNVAQALLNHAGTVLAVVWKDNLNTNAYEENVMTIFREQNMDVEKVSGKEYDVLLKDFNKKKNWLRHTEVDRLSMIEAGEIATRLVARVTAKTSLSNETVSALKKDFETLFKNRFIIMNTTDVNKDPNLLATFRQETEHDMLAAGKKYLDAGQMNVLQAAIALGLQPVEGEAGYEKEGCCSKPKGVLQKSGSEKNNKKSCCSKSSN
jgi:hypothetical protein